MEHRSGLFLYPPRQQKNRGKAPPWAFTETLSADHSEGWTLDFPDGSPVEMPSLVSWSDLTDDAYKYHSGTATYRKTVPWHKPEKSARFFIDLGRVEVVARVTVNGIDCGIACKQPYRVDVTAKLHRRWYRPLSYLGISMPAEKYQLPGIG